TFGINDTIPNGLIFGCHRTRLIVIIDHIEHRTVVPSIYAAIPPVEYHIVGKGKLSPHAHRRITACIIGPKVSHEGAIQPSNGTAKRMIVSGKPFGRNGIL